MRKSGKYDGIVIQTALIFQCPFFLKVLFDTWLVKQQFCNYNRLSRLNWRVFLKVEPFYQISRFRSSHLEVLFCKKGALKNFTKFTGKHLCWSLFFNKVAGLATSFKNWLGQMCFPVNFAKFLRTSFFIEHLWWLLLWSVKRLFASTCFVWWHSTQELVIIQFWCNYYVIDII